MKVHCRQAGISTATYYQWKSKYGGMDGIVHPTTSGATPRTNGFVERMTRTLLDVCFRVAGRQAWYITPPSYSAT